MSIKISGTKNKVRIGYLKKIVLFLFTAGTFSLSSVVGFSETFYAAGRGTVKNGTIWKYTNNAWSVHSEIPDCSELFCLAVDKNGNLVAGGNYFGYAVVWTHNGITWDAGKKLTECRGLYAVTVDKNGNIWAGGPGKKNIWKYDGVKWDEGTKLEDCTGIYAIITDKAGNVWAGGEGKKQIWNFNGKEWDKGTKLSDCTDVFSLTIDQDGIVWAGGRGGKVLWWFKDNQWMPGTILLDSTEISAFSLTENGKLYSVGAGRNKVWQKNTEIDWAGENLNECIAVYSASSFKNKILTGGWNLQRKGRVWIKDNDKWDNGTDIENCYVIRSIVSGKD
jgi:hypothetical protein